jgi:hypothetical protein
VREDVPAEGTYRFVLDPAVMRATGGRLRIDFSALARPPRDKEVGITIRSEGGEQLDVKHRSEVAGIPPGPCQVRIRAPGVEETSQPVVITAGQTTVLAAHAKPPHDGTVRGRVVVHGNDDWLRLANVRFRNTATGDVAYGSRQLGLQSFTAQLEPGHYTGEVHVGRLVQAEARAAMFDDVTVLDPRYWSEAEVTGSFEANVRLGEITDLIVEVDAPAVPAPSPDPR